MYISTERHIIYTVKGWSDSLHCCFFLFFHRPFGQCYEFLTLHTVKKFFLPVIEMVPQFLENLTDEELKKEAKNEARNDALSLIIKSLKNLASRLPGQEETVKNLEIFRLKMILR